MLFKLGYNGFFLLKAWQIGHLSIFPKCFIYLCSSIWLFSKLFSLALKRILFFFFLFKLNVLYLLESSLLSLKELFKFISFLLFIFFKTQFFKLLELLDFAFLGFYIFLYISIFVFFSDDLEERELLNCILFNLWKSLKELFFIGFKFFLFFFIV